MPRPKLPLRRKKGACTLCKEKLSSDWKDVEFLAKYMSERGRISSTASTNVCAKHQRKLALAIKRARYIGLLPFVTKVK